MINDKFEAIQHLYQIHCQDYIPEITKYDRQVRETVIFFSDSKSQAFVQLVHVHRMVPAWGATLIEIVRRKEYVKVFLAKAKEMAEILSKMRVLEERRRTNFKNEIARYLPVGLVKGLDDPLPVCEFGVSGTHNRLPDLTREDIADFEKTISAIRFDHQGDPRSHTATDAISKLQATLLKMSTQIDSIPVEFEKMMVRGAPTSSHVLKLEEENARLKNEIAVLRGGSTATTKVAPTPESAAAMTPSSQFAKHEETILAYEARIKSLEKLLHQQYGARISTEDSHISNDRRNVSASHGSGGPECAMHLAQISQLQTALSEAQLQIHTLESEKQELAQRCQQQRDQLEHSGRQNAELTQQYQDMCAAYDKAFAGKQQAESQSNFLRGETEKFKQFLGDIRDLLIACSQTLRSDSHPQPEASEQKSQQQSGQPAMIVPTTAWHAQHNGVLAAVSAMSGRSPSRPATIDDVWRQMRILQDDVIWHTALVASMRNSMQDSHEGSDGTQSVAGEMVALIQRLGETENRLRSVENDLTVAQAHEAVLEAELESLRVLHNHSEANLTKAKQQRKDLQQVFDNVSKELAVKRSEHDQLAHTCDELNSRLLREAERYQATAEALNQVQSQLTQLTQTHSQQSSTVAHLQNTLSAQKQSAEATLESLSTHISRMQELIEDWSIVSRLSLELVVVHVNGINQLCQHILKTRIEDGMLSSDDVSIDDILAFLKWSLTEMGDFVQKYSQTVKMIYGKVVALGSAVHVSDLVEQILKEWRLVSDRVSARVAFQK
eukprot:jgi/Hompol1/5735/HPOL_002525-RA